MTEFKPRPGDRVYLTLLAKVNEYGDYFANTGDDGGQVTVPDGSPAIVRVESVELPTEFGAMILARTESELPGRGKAHPVLLTLGESDHEPAWFIAGSTPFRIVPALSIQPGWVQIDPDTMRPVGESS